MTEADAFIDVAVALPVYQTYTYKVPANLVPLIAKGKRVLVPFGKRRVTGFILGPGDDSDKYETKMVHDILDEAPLFPCSMIPLFRWLSEYYLYPLGEVIKNALPGGLTIYDHASLMITEKGLACLGGNNPPGFGKDVLEVLKNGACSRKSLDIKLKRETPSSVINKLITAGLVDRKIELKGAGVRPKMEKYVSVVRTDIPDDQHYEKRKTLLDTISQHCRISLSELRKKIPELTGLLPYLENNGFISIKKEQVFRDPFGDIIKPDTPPCLNREQQAVVTCVGEALEKGFSSYLLSGVTSSGKTEVYMHLAGDVMDKGYTVLVLVPEISLISQTERRFRARFGEKIAVLHSGLSNGERYDQWRRILTSDIRIVIGVRSAVFAPLSNIGMIIVDEEHDGSYKQDSALRYNARDVAVVRAKLSNAVVLLGSATPSIQSAYNAKTEKFFQVSLKYRVNKRPLPEITVVDMCKIKKETGIKGFITPPLYEAMKETLARGEQTLLFLNRRGFANFPVCADCGETLKCKNCDISLTLHKHVNAFKCHFCGYSKASTIHCSACGSPNIRLLGVGTEKLAETVSTLFPLARVARLDRDTTARKGAMLKILKALRQQEIDILVGTQMVAKGHDFPNITLVGIVCADLSLNFPDFRAGEQTFQLLAQVAGRAGRGDAEGRVIMQTYNPEHFSILAAKDQDYDMFYENEIVFRNALKYPPFSRMIQLKISGKNEEKTKVYAHMLGDRCHDLVNEFPDYKKYLEILGPIESPLTRIANRFRWQILLKGGNAGYLKQFVRTLMLDRSSSIGCSGVTVVVDVDPMSMM